MNTLTHRYKAWFLLEAETPLSIGSGYESLTTDRLVARNAVGFPYIPGTGLAGALRSALEKELHSFDWDEIWGDKTRKTKPGGDQHIDVTRGSRLIVNSAHLLGEDGSTALEGLASVNKESDYYKNFNSLPERDHVRINERGVAVDKAKFDEQVCFKGVRFLGSIELLGTSKDNETWQLILNQFASPFFRIGGGTRKGFGKLSIKKLQNRIYDLIDTADRTAYLKDDNNLQSPPEAKNVNTTAPTTESFTSYKLTLTPVDFFIFGAGFGDDEADDVYKTEKRIDWNSAMPTVIDKQILIPASSIKGALRHRLAFHYNKEIGNLVNETQEDDVDVFEKRLKELETLAEVPEGIASDDEKWKEVLNKIQEASFKVDASNRRGEKDETSKNAAVRALFGYAADDTTVGGGKGQRGNVLISDVYLSPAEEKVFDHVRLDRFTGGASDGALFQEKTVFTKEVFELEILVGRNALNDTAIKKAWDATIEDLCEGRLPLGGKTTKGHGFFKRSCNIDLQKKQS